MLRLRISRLLLVLPIAAGGCRDVSIAAELSQPLPVMVTPAPGGPVTPEQILPPNTNGILPPGAADEVLPVGAQPVIKLLEPGAAPQADLSYALVKGRSDKMLMSMDMSVSVKMSGQSMQQTPTPRMTMTFDATASDESTTGEFRIDSLLSAVGVEPDGEQQEQMARTLRPELEAMKGLGMSYWVSPKGRVRDVKLNIPPDMSASAQQLLNGMSQSFESMVTPLPAEPVGVGARWQLVTRVASGGADILQVAVYTLKSRAGNRATLEASFMQLAANDVIHGPQMPADMSAKVKALRSSGTGSTQIDVNSVTPEGGTMTSKTGMDIAIQGGGPDSGGDTTVETTTTVEVSRL